MALTNTGNHSVRPLHSPCISVCKPGLNSSDEPGLFGQGVVGGW